MYNGLAFKNQNCTYNTDGYSDDRKQNNLRKREDKKRKGRDEYTNRFVDSMSYGTQYKKLNTSSEKPSPICVSKSSQPYGTPKSAENAHKIRSGVSFSTSSLCSLPFAADTQIISTRGYRDYSKLLLKADHRNRPMWVCNDGYIYLEMFLNSSKQASDFLITMAEPICRPELVHEFQITIFSLYAAISVGLSVEDLLNNLNKFSKNYLPDELVCTIKENAKSFGKVKLVLRDNRHWIEASQRSELDYLLQNSVIKKARIVQNSDLNESKKMAANEIEDAKKNFANVVLTHLNDADKTKDNWNGKWGIGESPEKSGVSSCVGKEGLEAENACLEAKGGAAQPCGDAAYVTSAEPVLDSSQLAFKTSEKYEGFPSKSQHSNLVTNNVPVHKVFSFEVRQNMIEEVKRVALEEMKRPLLMEYDFRKDRRNPNLEAALRSNTSIRYYQERALRKMFSNGRARSGIIVLPCGAGKTLTGITAACTMRKSTMVLTTSSVAVHQWKKHFEEFTNINLELVKTLTSDHKSDLWSLSEAGILVSTYTMMAFSGRRSETAERIIQQVKEREWGLLIFDEVQFAPAPAFRRINEVVRSHCKLGLTATLVREDDLIKDLQWLIGPKLYEANWLELQEKGYLAKVSCSEIWCPMTAEFFCEYIRCSSAKQRKLWVCNPNKMMACEFLIKYHEARGDKVIVFSDNLFALNHGAHSLHKPFICGSVSPAERMAVLTKFKTDSTFNTIFLSKVGDNAIDIPCANVVIQISFNFASRRQEAQRLGRILRPKPRSEDNDFNAFFYSLVSKDTQEMVYADKRQQFIIDQGYSYNVLHVSDIPLDGEELVYRDPEKQKEILKQILISDDTQADDDEDENTFIPSKPANSMNGSNQAAGGSYNKQADVGFSSNLGDFSTLYNKYRNKSSAKLSSGGKASEVEKKDPSLTHPMFKQFYTKKK